LGREKITDYGFFIGLICPIGWIGMIGLIGRMVGDEIIKLSNYQIAN